MTLLSVLIPARNEQFLTRTVEDLLANLRGDTEIIVVLDGAPAVTPLPVDPRVRVVEYTESIGQRAATNAAARLSQGDFVMKVDAHCAFDEGFDVKLVEPYRAGELEMNVTTVPIMRNLHAFDWVCPEGHRRYQGPSGPCLVCGQPTEMDLCWVAKTNPSSKSYCFDAEPHFQYFREFSRRPAGIGELTESLSLQGSCFLLTHERYDALNICDEALGTWGSQGIEVALKTWLSGGRVVVNQRTWYAHLFRTQGGDFGFPYHLTESQVEHAKQGVRELFFEGHWPRLKRPLSWLLEKFWPVRGWTETDLAAQKARETGKVFAEPKSESAGLVYYTDNRCDETLWRAAQAQLLRCCNGFDLVSVSLQPIDFGRNIVLPLERGPLTLFRQILAGLEASTADVIFLVEHDVLYHPSHFEFRPERSDAYYYNQANWKVDLQTGQALFYLCHQTLALCARRELLLAHYRARVARVEREGGYNRETGFEPGDHRTPRGIDDYPSESWRAAFPNLDVRHGKNLTPSRWQQSEFRNPKACLGWTEADEVPGWGRTAGRMQAILKEVTYGLS